jgi:hypothetical protein
MATFSWQAQAGTCVVPLCGEALTEPEAFCNLYSLDLFVCFVQASYIFPERGVHLAQQLTTTTVGIAIRSRTQHLQQVECCTVLAHVGYRVCSAPTSET